MFSLLIGLWEYLFKTPSLHILIIGLDYAGKSSILERIKAQYGPKTAHVIPMDRIPPTIGMNIAKIKHMGAQIVFWDLGGQSKMRSIWERYYNAANGVIFVVDATDNGRLQEAKREFEGVLHHDVMNKVPMVILANKQDLNHALSAEDLAHFFQQGVDQLTAKAFPVSALTGCILYYFILIRLLVI